MGNKGRDIWLKAAVAGSLWASVEIVAGSFLHNLRIPLAGTILAVMGLSLMIAFQYKWNDRGLIWRAGLITALMKSLSPSAIILGPMVGILTEAILLDFFVRLLGQNATGYLLGSVSAVMSALFHKVVTIIMLYGFHIVVILENMYHFAEKQLKVKGPAPINLILWLILLYMGFGIIAAFTGMMAGKRMKKLEAQSITQGSMKEAHDFSISGETRYSLGFLILHLVMLVGGLFLISKTPLYFSAIILVPYLIILIVKYKKSLRRLAKPLFWFQLIVILIVAIFFWNEYAAGKGFESSGLIVGLMMIFRALLVVMTFSAISVELRNPLVKAVLYKKGFSGFYTAMSLAFSVLPEVMKRLERPATLISRPIQSLSQIILYSEDIFRRFKQHLDRVYPVYIITGDQREGKTTFLTGVVTLLNHKGIEVGGIIARGIDHSGRRTGFILRDVSNGKEKLLCTDSVKKGWANTGRFYFSPGGLQFGEQALKKIPGHTIGVVDEIGPLELTGQGWSASLIKLLDQSVVMIWVVRRELTEKIIQHFNLKNTHIFDIACTSVEELVSRIILDSKARLKN